MMLKNLLQRHMEGDSVLSNMLAVYNDRPAIFYQRAPTDTSELWGNPMYPRVDYNIDMREDPERKISGVVAFNIWGNQDVGVKPEQVEKRLVDLISGTFFTVGDKTTFCTLWSGSEMFEYSLRVAGNLKNQTQPRTYGLTVLFDVMAFPVQATAEPDPLKAINRWTKTLLDTALVVAYDELPEVWKPQEGQPAVYWRPGGDDVFKQSYAVSWHECQIIGHVITESVNQRTIWLKKIAGQLSAVGEINLSGNSPLLINKISTRHNADQLRDGQIVVTGTYGALSPVCKQSTTATLVNKNFQYKQTLKGG